MIVIITTSGLGSRLGSLTTYTNKALVKLGDRCVIDYIMDKYVNMYNVSTIIITLGYKGDLVRQYIDLMYGNIKINIKYVIVDKYKGIGSSLGYSLLCTQSHITEPFMFHCCDSVVLDDININTETNCLYVFMNNHSSQYTTITGNNGIVTAMYDKGHKTYDYCYSGIAYIHNYDLFFEILKNLHMLSASTSLSDIHVYMSMLKKGVPLHYITLHNYHDTGNIDAYSNAQSNFTSKYSILHKDTESIIFHDDCVVKFFADKQVNLDRINRGKRLKTYMNYSIPEIYAHTENFHKMEYVPCLTMSCNLTTGSIKQLLDWSYSNLWLPYDTDQTNFEKLCRVFYLDKTNSRVKQYFDEGNNDYHLVNGQDIGSIQSILDSVDFGMLCQGQPCQFHGDYVLDNILYNKSQYYLIDWRQSFSGELEYGDIYYDLAKLRHSLYLSHSNIEAGLYDYSITNQGCNVDMKCNYNSVILIGEFDKYVIAKGYSIKKIQILQGLIWINMAPLHPVVSTLLFHLGKSLLYNSIHD